MMKRLLAYAIAALLLLSVPAGAAESEAEGSQAEFSPKEMVMEHLADSYQWEITNIKGRELVVPLPVIVRSSTGWHVFLSSKIYPVGTKYNGLYIAHEGKYKDKLVEDVGGEQKRPLDISLTKTACGTIFALLVVMIIFLVTARSYKKHDEIDYCPKGLAGIMEWQIDSLLTGIIKPCVGENYRKFAPYLLTAFFFIFVANLLGLIPFFPGGANVTGNITITFFMAFATMLAVNLFGSKHYYKDIFWPDVPIFLKAIPIMPVIELIGIFTKPFALMMRLFANILAGHSIILSIASIIFVTAHMGAALNSSMTAVSVFFMIFMNFLELLVAYIQAYVFTMLSSVFIGLAQE